MQEELGVEAVVGPLLWIVENFFDYEGKAWHELGFYYRMDKNFVDEENWHCFVNSIYDKETKAWTCFKRAHVDLVDKSKLFKPAAH